MDSSSHSKYESFSHQGNTEVKVFISASIVISTDPVIETNDDISTLLQASRTHDEVIQT
ncbi:hypothetical protein DPMN_185061 [Dreissena polymorpha]|uniref:Uncharacterized protein n=1 Tax=Dreissena polymorpha TaxID=45954 RepID=A0A9D4I6Z7_DREPO|nr:hypothetical protein DPMN_185061 [Dreissena polymorpha]